MSLEDCNCAVQSEQSGIRGAGGKRSGGASQQFAAHLEEISLEILDRPTPKLLQKARVQPGSLLLGLYIGRAITQRHVEDSGVMPDVIYIFLGADPSRVP